MTDFENIYNNYADAYDFLVNNEDYQDNLWKELYDISNFKDKIVVEFGAGTGRLTKKIVEKAKFTYAFDLSQHMIDKALENISKKNFSNYKLGVANNISIPLDDKISDITIEGWSFGHLIMNDFNNYKRTTDKLIDEMFRLLKKNGISIIIETLGTCKTEPVAPAEELRQFYNYLENEHGFKHKSVRTDYKYNSVEEAIKSFEFFFGKELANYVRINNNHIIPECTGIWWKEKT